MWCRVWRAYESRVVRCTYTRADGDAGEGISGKGGEVEIDGAVGDKRPLVGRNHDAG